MVGVLVVSASWFGQETGCRRGDRRRGRFGHSAAAAGATHLTVLDALSSRMMRVICSSKFSVLGQEDTSKEMSEGRQARSMSGTVTHDDVEE